GLRLALALRVGLRFAVALRRGLRLPEKFYQGRVMAPAASLPSCPPVDWREGCGRTGKWQAHRGYLLVLLRGPGSLTAGVSPNEEERGRLTVPFRRFDRAFS